jgi:hypothetical protein
MAPPQPTRVTRRDLARWAFGGVLLVVGAHTLRRVFMPRRLDDGGRRTLAALLDASWLLGLAAFAALLFASGGLAERRTQ